MKEGDRELLLGRDVARMVERWARLYSRTPWDLEDARQDGYLKAATYLRDREGVPRDQVFLFRLNNYLRAMLAARLCALGRHHARFATFGREAWAEFASSPRDPGDAAALPDDVAAAMEQLPARYRRSLEYRYAHDLDPGRVAELLGVTRETAELYIHHGKRQVRAILAGRGPARRTGGRPRSATHCGQPGCGRRHKARGLCSMHYLRKQRAAS